MEARPDSALLYLACLSDSVLELEPEETRMYYQMLTVMAHDKSYHRHTSDSLINTIVRFYDNYGNLYKKMEAYYYLASVYRDLNDAPRAIKIFQQVADLGKNTTEYNLLDKTYSQMGILLAFQGLPEEAEKAGRKELAYSILNKDSIGTGYALRNIGRTFHARQQIDSALHYYQQAYERSPASLKNAILIEMPSVYYDNKEPDKAKVLILELFDKQIYFSNNWLLLGEIYQQEQQPEKARYCFGKALHKSTISQVRVAYQKLFEVEKQLGNNSQALDYAAKYVLYQDSINKKTKTETVAKIQALYNFQLYEEEHDTLLAKNQNNRLWIFILSLALLLLFGSGYYYFKWLGWKKEKVIRQERKLRFLEEMKHQQSLNFIEENKLILADLEMQKEEAAKEKDIFKQRLIATEKRLVEYSNRKAIALQDERSLLETNLKDLDIYHFFHQANEDGSIIKNEEKWKQLQMAIDTTYYKFTDRLQMLYPNLSEIELRICYLIKISIPLKDIASTVGRSSSAITNARLRLYKKLKGKEGKAEDLDRFILDL